MDDNDSKLGVVKQLMSEYVERTAIAERLIETQFHRKPSITKYVFDVDIESIALHNQNELLANYLVENTSTALVLMRKTILEKLRQNKDLMHSKVEELNVWLALRPINLPHKNLVSSYRVLESFTENNGLLSIKDSQIVSITRDWFKSVIGFKFVCVKCVNGSYDKWRVRQLEEQEEDSKRSVSIPCSNCGEMLVEDRSARTYVQKRMALIKIGSEHKSGFNAKQIHITRELCDSFESLYIGEKFDVINAIKEDANNCYDVLSFAKSSTKVTISSKFLDNLEHLPQCIKDLYLDRHLGSPYSFALSLAYVFADQVSAYGSYFRLKLGLLLSLISINDYPEKRDASILVICDDTLMVSRILEVASYLAKSRYVQRSPTLPIAGVSRIESTTSTSKRASKSTSRSASKSKQIWIDGGSLQLSSDGICVIPFASHLNSLPNKEKASLFHTLDANQVVVKVPINSTSTQFNSQLKSVVWAVLENESENIFGAKSSKMKKQSFSWPEVFGMVYMIQEEKIDVSFKSSDSAVSISDWKAFLKRLTDFQAPDITPEADMLICGYYVAIRCVRGVNCRRFSVSTIISLAKAFAKLSLRNSVEKCDALMAILIYEESLTSRFGNSPLNVMPVFHLSNNAELCRNIGQNFDSKMNVFEKDLLKFIEQFAKSSLKNVPQIAIREE